MKDIRCRCKNAKSVFDDLHTSIILPLSQGGSELFHSNLLHHLAEKESRFFRSVLKGLGIDAARYVSVKREYRHTDLAFFDVDVDEYAEEGKPLPPPVFIIENKIKSLPTAKQVDTYISKLFPGMEDTTKKHKRLMFLLPFSRKYEAIPGYEVISYAQLGNNMAEHIDEIDDEFTRTFIKKYAEFVINFNIAIDQITEPDLNEVTVGDYFDHKNPEIQSFASIRLSSIAWKLRMAYLQKELRRRFEETGLKVCDNLDDYHQDASPDHILVGVSLSNAKPIVECFISLNEGFEYFIQLDNGVYNHGVILKYSTAEAIKLIKDKKQKDKKKREVIDSVQDQYLKKLIVDLGIGNTNNKGKLLSYNNMFYNHGDNVKKMTLGEVLDKIVNEIENLRTEYKKQTNNNN